MVQISIKTLTWWPSSSEGGSNIKLKSDKVLAVVKTTVGENLEGDGTYLKVEHLD